MKEKKVVLFERGLDNNGLSKEKFVELFSEDLIKVCSQYKNSVEENNKKFVEWRIEQQSKRIIDYAERRYVREYYKKKYIEKELESLKNYYKPDINPIITFNFPSNLDSLNIPQHNRELGLNTTKETLENLYDSLINDGYFPRATGYRFIYYTSRPIHYNLANETISYEIPNRTPEIEMIGLEEEIKIINKRRSEICLDNFYR